MHNPFGWNMLLEHREFLGKQRLMKKIFLVLVIINLIGIASASSADDMASEALYAASTRSDVKGVKAELAKGGDPNYLKYDRSIFSWSVQNGDVEIVRALLEGKPKLNEVDGIGHTPLMRAADQGHADIAQLLLKAGADPNIATEDGTTALILAARYSPVNPDLVRALIDGKADPNAKNRDDEFALAIAVRDQKFDLIPVIAKAKIDWNQSGVAHTALGAAVDQGSREGVEALLKAGADPNVKGETNQAPLIMALDNQEIFHLLLNAKANPNIKNSWGQTALMVAVSADQADRVIDLIKAGADLKAESDMGQNALQFAQNQGLDQMVELLKRYGAE